jgi:hypothetical protein
VFPVEIGLRDPRSQKRDLGHPSISPFDIAEGTSFVISLPTRLSESAARDDKGEGCVHMEGGGWTRGDENAFCPVTALHATVSLSFVIPSEADLSRRAVEGSAVPRTLPGYVFRQERSIADFSLA